MAVSVETVWEFLTVREEAGTCTVEGYHRLYGMPHTKQEATEAVKPLLLINSRTSNCESIRRDDLSEKNSDNPDVRFLGFRAEFPLEAAPLFLQPVLETGSSQLACSRFLSGQFFPLSALYDSAYACMGNRIILRSGTGICILKKLSFFKRVSKECRFLREIWEKNLLGGRKAAAGRLCFHLAKPLMRKKLWIVSDRTERADDSGEFLFYYLRKHKPKNTRILFAVQKGSPDYQRISGAGPCIDAMSYRHKLLYLLADVLISSQADFRSMFAGYDDAVRDILAGQRYVFLQHGVTKDDLSAWLNRYNQNLSGFVTSAEREYQSIVQGAYGYPEQAVWLTGLPRFDAAYRAEEKKITVMPTWRRYLLQDYEKQTGCWNIAAGAEKSAYVVFYRALLNSERLLGILEEYGYTLQFFSHPNMVKFTGLIDHDPRVKILSPNTSYRYVYAESNLLITDYSSAVFDFAYLRKPILYCQPDREEFFSGHTYEQGYFDYARDGFGETAYDLETTVDLIIEYVKNDCKLKDSYRTRIDDFFAYDDRNNCQRVAEKLMELC